MIAQLCIGAGALALPYAVYRGGLLFSPLFLGVVAVWNAIACSMIIKCKHVCKGKVSPPSVTSTYSKIAYAGGGVFGLFLTDFSIIVTLIGVCISCQITFAILFQGLVGGKASVDSLTFVSGLLVYPICCAKNVGILSSISLAGLVSLTTGIVIIILSGIYYFGDSAWKSPFNSDFNDRRLTLWPQSTSDATSLIGVAIFCFGLCSMAFRSDTSSARRWPGAWCSCGASTSSSETSGPCSTCTTPRASARIFSATCLRFRRSASQ